MHSYTSYSTPVANQDLKKNAASFPNVNSKWWYTKERKFPLGN